MKFARILLPLLIAVLMLSACRAPVVEQEEQPAEQVGEVILEVQGLDGEPVQLTMNDLEALPAVTGYAGRKSSTGHITPPAEFTGVLLTDLVGLVGGMSEQEGIRVQASDGYAMTFSYSQITNGDFIAYNPGTGTETETDPFQVILAYKEDGEYLIPDTEGNLRVYLINDDPMQVTDGHWSIKFVNRIELKPLAEDWLLFLEGAVEETIDRATFETGAAPNCHLAVYIDEDGRKFSGIPLWYLAGRVDDENVHEDDAFNRDLAAAGYTINLTAGDGYSVSFSSTDIAENDDIIIAYLMDDEVLEEKHFPLRLVGPDLEGSQKISQIVSISLDFSETVMPVEEAETEEEPETALVDVPIPTEDNWTLTIAGATAEQMTWTMADLLAMESIDITAEHPKKGAQDYTGVSINSLLDLVQPSGEATTLTFTASDGYAAQAALSDIRICADCLVAFDETSLRLALPGFDDSSLWIKELYLITIQ
ncbi:MAG: molybdopterin-dependent oxidoreductase [Anaerolineales bacterium]|nr:molybdopterin-dependent oxidoreductase [Anaerolineales bacterium]